jgi:predicted SprT family Zn-dependent metalloprotease
MNQTQALVLASHHVDIWWTILKRLYPAVGTKPQTEISNRMKTCAGMMYYEQRIMRLSFELFAEYPEETTVETIPHELVHQVSWDIHQHGGHGQQWKNIMRTIGKEPTRCHSMINTKHEARKAGVKL